MMRRCIALSLAYLTLLGQAGAAPFGCGPGATPLQAKATGTTGSVVATLTGLQNDTVYLCHWDVQAVGGTAAVGPITVAGLLGGSWTYQLTDTAGGVQTVENYAPCLQASGVNTAITVTTTASAGATAVDVQASGCHQ
jgi:hypothetical protein